jgi:hypothetical protein
MAYKLSNPENTIVANKGALHEQLSAFIRQLQIELAEGGSESLLKYDADYLAGSLLSSITHSGDRRIADLSLNRWPKVF